MNIYTVKKLARLAGVSVRTLHHYDQIGLLKPSGRSAAGYRLYAEKDLLHLQQILFYRELGFSLADIQTLLSRPSFDPLRALQEHRLALQRQAERVERLIQTVDKTIQYLTEEKVELNDEELYEGFTQEQVERYQREVYERYDPALVDESFRRVRKMSKEQWQAVKQQGDDITRRMAGLMGCPAGDPQVQATIAQHRAWLENFYPVSREIYEGLANGYVENDEFRATYERYTAGLAEFMRNAMLIYCKSGDF